MPFTRGATLTTATTFGHSDTSNLGPTAGNGFYKRWPDDLALLQDLGLTDIRLTFDWARLQPRPGEFDGDWADRFEQMLAAADAIGLAVWATLHDGAEPRWITNEGGIHDDTVAEKWWPRFAERVADRFGEQIAGWIPYAGIDNQLSVAGWRNTWTTLSGGSAPVVAALDTERLDAIADYLDTADIIGINLQHGELSDSGSDSDSDAGSDSGSDAAPDDEQLDRVRARLHETISEAAEAAADHRLMISQFTAHHADADVAGQIVEALVIATTEAVGDGVDLGAVFIDPAIEGPDSPHGLLSAERVSRPAADAFLASVAAD